MKQSEANVIIGMLKAFAPAVPTRPGMDTVWMIALGDVPYPAVEDAVRYWIRNRTGFPYPAEIREIVAERALGLPSPEMAWAAVDEWAGRPPGPEHHPDLPAAVKEAVKSVGGIRAIRLSERPDLTRRQFIEAYTARRQEAVRTADLSLAALPEGR